MPRKVCSISWRMSGVGFAPTVWHVGHQQQAEAVGPVKLARHIHFDMQAVRVEADAGASEGFHPA